MVDNITKYTNRIHKINDNINNANKYNPYFYYKDPSISMVAAITLKLINDQTILGKISSESLVEGALIGMGLVGLAYAIDGIIKGTLKLKRGFFERKIRNECFKLQRENIVVDYDTLMENNFSYTKKRKSH